MGCAGFLLDDGRSVTVRRTAAADAPALQAFVGALSWRAKVERFFLPIRELSPRQLQAMLEGRGFSLGAFDAHGALVAHAQYALDERGEAEFGIVVADAWQAHGLGARLMEELLEHAHRAGIDTFGGVTLSDNSRMRRLARKLGFVFKRDDDPQLVRMQRWLGAPA
jgi:acetyltransferase